MKLYRQNREPDNAAQPWRGSSTAPTSSKDGESVTVFGCFVPISGSGLGKMISEGAFLESGATQAVLIATNSLLGGFTAADVENANTLEDGGTVYRITTKQHLKPGSTSIAFALGVTL